MTYRGDLKVVSFDGHNLNEGTNYEAGFMPANEWGIPKVKPKPAKRDGSWPLLGSIERDAMIMQIHIRIVGSDIRSLRDDLLYWLDYEAEESAQFIVQNEGGGETRFVNCICTGCEPITVSGIASTTDFIATFQIDGDIRWRSPTTGLTNAQFFLTASGQQKVVTNAGSDRMFPHISIKPTSAKTGGYAYKQFIPVVWNSDNPCTFYPIRLGPFDTATLTTAKMQADGDDLRIYVDGIEVDRWLVDMDTANTYVWVNFDFAAQQTDELVTAIAGTGSIDSIEVGEGIYDFPDSGLLIIGSEVFAYTDRDLAEEKFTGITRAAKGSSMGSHSVSDTVYWIQHEVYMKYGNASATNPPEESTLAPMFTYATAADNDNTQWTYTNFDTVQHTRSGRWAAIGNETLYGNGGVYTATHRTISGTSVSVMGAWADVLLGHAYGWELTSPIGIVNAEWSNGEHRAEVTTNFVCHVQYWLRDGDHWDWQYDIPDPSAADTWDTWSKAKNGTDWEPADAMALALYHHPSDVGVSDCVIYFNTDEEPDVYYSACAEQGNYELDMKITNVTTDEWIRVTFDMELNETLTVDTYADTVVYEADGTSQYQAVADSSVRTWRLQCVPGTNTIQFDDTGTNAVTIDFDYYERWH